MANNTLKAVISLQDDYTAKIKTVISSTEDAESKLKQVNSASEEFSKKLKDIGTNSNSVGSSVSGLVTKLGALVTVGYAIRTAFSLAWEAIQTATKQTVQLNTMQALVGNDQIGSGLYEWVSDYAEKSMLGREDISQGVMSFLSTTRNFDELQQLVGMAERLYAKDPTQGSEGAIFALKEVLAGDTVSMRNRYGITGFSGETIREMIANGQTAEAIQYISDIMDNFGASEAVVEKNSQSLSTQLNILTSNFKTEFGESMMGVMEALLPTIKQLSEDLSAGKFQPFFDLMANGGLLVANVFSFLAKNADLVKFALVAVAAATAANFITSIVAATGVTAIFNATLLANPLVWFVGLLALGVGGLALFESQVNKTKKSLASDTTIGGFDYNSDEFKDLLANTKVKTSLEGETVSVTGNVNIEEDNLKYLLDIAEREYVAKFSTATLAPQVSVTFGDVHETADVNQIISQIDSAMSDMIATEAEGAYS